MDNLTICRFITATADATPEDVCSAPLHNDDPTKYDFLTLLTTFAEHQEAGGFNDYFSLSKWSGGHSEYHHEGTTCLTLEYKEDKATEVRAALKDLEYAFYEIPTKAGRSKSVLFAIPLEKHLDHTDTTRAASIVAESVGATGLVKNSFLYTYFFRFRSGAGPVTYNDGKPVPARLVGWANKNRIITNLKAFIR